MDVVFLGHTQQYSRFTPGSASEITPVDVQVSIYDAVDQPRCKGSILPALLSIFGHLVLNLG